MPYTGPRDAQYDLSQIPLPANFDAPPTPDQPLKTRLFHETYRRQGFGGHDLQTERGWREIIARYWGLCSQVDTHLGTILAALAESGQYDDTIIVYTSDHGDMMGSHQLLAKCVMFEEATRVPLLIKLPGQSQGRRVGGVTSQVDLVPTLLDLMGQEIPPELQGKSLRDAAEGQRTLADEEIFIEWNGLNNGFGDVLGQASVPAPMRDLASEAEAIEAIGDPVRTIVCADGWKLNVSPRGEHELYDLNSDPAETVNLAGRAEHSERVAELTEKIQRWQQRTGDRAGGGR